MKSLGERLRHVRTVNRKMSQEEFSALVGVTQRSWSRYEKGHTVPDADVIARVCEATGVTLDWLLLGKGTMRDEKNSSQAKIMPSQSRRAWQPPVIVSQEAEDDPWKLAKWQEVPVIGLGNCGHDGWYSPGPLALRIPVPVDYPYNPHNFAVLAVGSSMQPEGIRQGFVLFCDPSVGFEAGDVVYVEKADGLAAIKKFLKFDDGKLHLQGWLPPAPDGSQQPYYEEIDQQDVKKVVCVVVIKRK